MRRILISLVLPLAMLAPAAAQDSQPATPAQPAATPIVVSGNFATPADAGGIVDLALIYQGGTHRLAWTPEQFAPYVSFDDRETSREQWLFDGFLFLEFKDNRGHEFAEGYKQKPAARADWEWYLDRIFEPGKSVSALDQATSTVIARIGAPVRPRRVVLTVPEPILKQANWGEIDGRALDFSKTEDRAAAGNWFVDQLLARWDKANLAHLELAGFYWVAERTRPEDRELMPLVAAHIHEKQKRFYWIPYWQADGAADWKQFGFDIAYQQPNHFFKEDVADSRLDEAVAFGAANGMGMEMEWDGKVMGLPVYFQPRMTAYLDAFDRHGVHAKSAMAHYEGGGAMIYLARRQDPETVALRDRYAGGIVRRQRAFDAQATTP